MRMRGIEGQDGKERGACRFDWQTREREKERD
jgi:hypothetical protein